METTGGPKHTEANELKTHQGQPANHEPEQDEELEQIDVPDLPNPAVGATVRLIAVIILLAGLAFAGVNAYRRGWIVKIRARSLVGQARQALGEGDLRQALELISEAWKRGIRDAKTAHEIVSWIATNNVELFDSGQKKTLREIASLLLGPQQASFHQDVLLAQTLYKIEAFDDLVRVLQQQPEESLPPELLGLFGKALFRQGRFRSLLEFAERNQKRLLNDEELRVYLALSRWATGEEGRVLPADVDKAIAERPTIRKAVLEGVLRGAVLLGDRFLAERALQELQRSGWSSYSDLAFYAFGLALVGYADEGNEVLSHWSAPPEGVGERSWQARLLIASGDYTSAAVALKRWLSASAELEWCILYALCLTQAGAREDTLSFASELLRRASANRGFAPLAYILQMEPGSDSAEVAWNEGLIQDLVDQLQNRSLSLLDLAELLKAKRLNRYGFQILRRQMEVAQDDPRYYPLLHAFAREEGQEYYVQLAATRFYKMRPWSPEAVLAYAEAQLMARVDPLPAIEACKRLIQHQPKNQGAKCLLAWALAQVEQVSEAKRLLAEIMPSPYDRLPWLWHRCAEIEVLFKEKGDAELVRPLITDEIIGRGSVFGAQRQFLYKLAGRTAP